MSLQMSLFVNMFSEEEEILIKNVSVEGMLWACMKVKGVTFWALAFSRLLKRLCCHVQNYFSLTRE